jgi:sortase B
MYRITSRLIFYLLLIVGVTSLSYAATVQWRRAQSDRAYTELTSQIPDGSLDEETSTDPDEVPGEKEEYVFTYNPSLHWINTNPDYVGWLRVEGTNIDYPLVGSKDNKDYLKLDFHRKRSDAGAIFMDYRNAGNFNDRHTVLYGHNMRNRTMFSQLDAFASQEFFSSSPLIELRGLYETKYYSVFSVHSVVADDYVIQVTFNDETYETYLNSLRSLSLYESDLVFDRELGLLSLVTCSDDLRNGRLIVHAIEVRP